MEDTERNPILVLPQCYALVLVQRCPNVPSSASAWVGWVQNGHKQPCQCSSAATPFNSTSRVLIEHQLYSIGTIPRRGVQEAC